MSDTGASPREKAPGPSSEAVRIGIGLIARRGHYLIRRRPQRPGSPMPGVWEFPGGKCEPGEAPEQATLRECLEETGLAVIIDGPERRIVRHRYPHGLVELHYFDARPAAPGLEPSPESGFLWAPAEALPDLIFPEANVPILAELAGKGRPRDETT